MHLTSIAVSPNPEPLNQPSTSQYRHRWGLPALLVLTAALIHVPASQAAPDPTGYIPTPAGTETTAYDSDRGGADDELDGSDDGTQALNGATQPIDVDLLRPVDLDEEQTLLGDWGDSENED